MTHRDRLSPAQPVTHRETLFRRLITSYSIVLSLLPSGAMDISNSKSKKEEWSEHVTFGGRTFWYNATTKSSTYNKVSAFILPNLLIQ
jgi:exo-beta-1,3-glucanase (GH17 family)